MKSIQIRIDEDLLKLIDKMAKDQQRSRSNMIHVLLKEATLNKQELIEKC